MKSTSFSLLALALGVSAGSVIDDTPSRVERDLPTITTVMNNVGDKLNALDQAVVAFSGGDSTAFQDAATSLETTIQDGLTQVQGTSNLSLSDALGLQSQVGTLQDAGTKLVSDLASKKTQIQDAGLCDTVRSQSTSLNDLSQQLINAITSKVPQEAQSIASQLTAGFTAALQQNQANFAQGNCTNAAGGSSSPSSSSASASTAPASTRPSTSAGAPTSKPSSTGTGTGGPRPTTTGAGVTGGSHPSGAPNATTSAPATVVTAGAALNAIPIGGLAFGFAALVF